MIIDYLKKNELASESNLYVLSDAAKSSEDLEKVTEIRKFKTINGFKSLKVIEREKNWSLSKQIIEDMATIFWRKIFFCRPN